MGPRILEPLVDLDLEDLKHIRIWGTILADLALDLALVPEMEEHNI